MTVRTWCIIQIKYLYKEKKSIAKCLYLCLSHIVKRRRIAYVWPFFFNSRACNNFFLLAFGRKRRPLGTPSFERARVAVCGFSLSRELRGVAMAMRARRSFASIRLEAVSRALPLCVFTAFLHLAYACVLIIFWPRKREVIFLIRFIGDIEPVEPNGIK